MTWTQGSRGGPVVDALGEEQQVRELIQRCLSGNRDAATDFQQRYGELIYGFPMRVYRTPPEDAGDFYVFAFEGGRIFRRVQTYEGRAPFRAYLLGCVLDNLVLEWRRGKHEIESVSIEEIGELADAAAASGSAGSETAGGPMDHHSSAHLLEGLEPGKAVVLKLLHVEDYDLGAAEVSFLADVSGRSVPDTLTAIDRLRAIVRDREAGVKAIEDALDTVQAWIRLYERRLQRLREDLAALPPTAAAAARLREEQADLERKIERRQQQRTKLLARMHRRKVTTPYKDLAAVLNTTVGNVGSQITRLRQELKERALPTEC